MIDAQTEEMLIPVPLHEDLDKRYSRDQIILSLYDMLRFRAASFVTVSRYLEQILAIPAVKRIGPDEGFWKKINDLLEWIEKDCKEIELTSLIPKIGRLKKSISSGISWETAFTLLQELQHSIRDELSQHLFLEISPSDRSIFQNIQLSEEAQDSFPSIVVDMDEAGKSFALERYTSCVFHVCRALEVPMTIMANEFGVSVKDRNWEPIINDIEKAIRDLGKSRHKDPNWKTKEQFYSEASVYIRHFKNAFRNRTMHNREFYDRSRAWAVLSNAKEFFDHLAKWLSE